MSQKILNALQKCIVIVKNKFHYPGLLAKIFNISNASKVIIIFTVGLISRILVGYYYDINVFLEYYEKISLTYYGLMAIFVVVLGEMFSYFNINIIPSFVVDYYTFVFDKITVVLRNFGKLNSRIFKTIYQVNINIYYYFSQVKGICINSSLSPEASLKEKIRYTAYSLIKGFSGENDKLILGDTEEMSKFDCSNKENTLKIKNLVHKGEDNNILPKTTYKPKASTTYSTIEETGESSNNSKKLLAKPLASQKDKGLEVDKVSNKSKVSLGLSDKSRSVQLGIREDDLNLSEALNNARLDPNISDQLRSSSVYSQSSWLPQEQVIRDNNSISEPPRAPIMRNLSTPSFGTPLFSPYPTSIASQVSNINYGYGPYNPNEEIVTINPPKRSNHNQINKVGENVPYYHPYMPNNSPLVSPQNSRLDLLTRSELNSPSNYPAPLNIRPGINNIAPTSASSLSLGVNTPDREPIVEVSPLGQGNKGETSVLSTNSVLPYPT